ncbi:MAG TPA: hypothetical protein VFF03_02000 [Rhodocyclaceae bacterium]|nr:hypothetical protein [Rhodocyclaceae bacterium]
MPALTLSTRIGIIDGLVSFVGWAIVAFVSASSFLNALPYLIAVLLPFSAYVGWQGARTVPKILAGQAPMLHVAFNGFWASAVITALALCALYAHDANAAGKLPFDYYFIYRLLPLLPVGGVVGAVHGIAVVLLNRALLHIHHKWSRQHVVRSNG